MTFFALVKTSFARLKISDLLQKSNTIYTAMLGNASFPNPVPDMPTLQILIQNLQQAQTVVDNGDLSGIPARDEARSQLLVALKSIGTYNNFTAQGSAALLSTTGYDIYKSGQPVILQPIKSITAISMPNTNAVGVKVAGAKGAKSLMFQYTTDPNKADGSWVSVSNTKRKFTIENLVKGTEVFVRVIASGSKGQQEVSETISRYVQ